jgi:SPP1 gp7 family putative phage head morphogenesis protein
MAKVSKQHKNKIRKKVENRRKTRPFKEPEFPDMIVLEYGKAIVKEVNKIDKLVKELLFPQLNKITNTKNERLDSSIRIDDTDNSFRNLFGVGLVAAILRKMKSRFYGELLGEDEEPRQTLFSKSIRRMSKPFLERTNNFAETRFVKEFENQTGTKPLERHLDVNEFIKDATRKNVALIKTVPQQYFNQIQTLVENAVDKGQLTREVKEEIAKIRDTAKTRARIIARDQVSKLVGVTEEARQRNLGVTHYIWRTLGDSRVRSFANSNGYSDHKRLDGTIQKWSQPPVTVFRGKRAGERNHPTQDIQCRCFPQAVFDEITGIEHPDTKKAREKTA